MRWFVGQELSQSEEVLVNTSAKDLSDTRTSAHQVFPSSNWLTHLYDVPSYGLAFDGYAPDNSPPPPFGPRMWAGGRVQWLSEPKFGDFTRQETSVESVKVCGVRCKSFNLEDLHRLEDMGGGDEKLTKRKFALEGM